jgi:hypothetical protein
VNVFAGRADRRLRASGAAEAEKALDAASGGDNTVSVGRIYVNGHESANAFWYRLTEKRLVWNRAADPQVAGFALGDVTAFGSWEDHLGHLVVGIDVNGSLWDLLFFPTSDRTKAKPGRQPEHLTVRFLLHALRDATGQELTERR